jgi:DNA-directed RNA polymerase subunit RPC12/RpoP
MKIICVYCGYLSDLEGEEPVQCNNCGFNNILLSQNKPKKLNSVLKIPLKLQNKKTQYAYLPFDNKTLQNMGLKQRKAISKFLKKEKLNKTDYDLLLKLAQPKEWERVKNKRDRLIAQETIYAYFNTYYKNINRFNTYKRTIKKIYHKLLQFIDEYIDNISKDLVEEFKEDFIKDFIMSYKAQYLDIIDQFPHLLEKSEKNLKLLKSLNINLDKFDENEWFYSIPLLSIIKKDIEIEEITKQQQFIEEKIKQYDENIENRGKNKT